MSLIDKTYFTLDLHLPDDLQYGDLTQYITRYEPEIIKKIFGYELAKQVIAYNPETTADPIKSLVEGAEYEDEDGHVQEWPGLVNSSKQSIIACYVYYWYLRAKVTKTTEIGEKRAAGENNVDAEYGIKQMAAWNKMLAMVESMSAYIETVQELLEIYRPTDLGSVNAFDL